MAPAPDVLVVPPDELDSVTSTLPTSVMPHSARTLCRPGTKADCRGGRVRIRVLAQNRHVVTSTVRTTTGCRYRLQDRAFALEADTAAITVQTRFLGSDSLAARSAPTNRIDLTP